MFFLPALLMLHLTALVLLAGTTLVDFVNFQAFWKLYEHQKEQASGILTASAKYSRLTGIGAALLIITGTCMLVLTHGVYARQVWFRIKIVLVLLLIVNSIFNGARVGMQLRKTFNANPPGMATQISGLKYRLQTFYFLQLSILLIIILLSAYKFN